MDNGMVKENKAGLCEDEGCPHHGIDHVCVEQAPKLISLKQAAQQGVDRVRLPRWAHKMDHLKIDIIAGMPGLWLHLYCPLNRACNGRDPVDTLGLDSNYDAEEFEIYQGPLPDSEEYKAEQKRYDDVFNFDGGAP